MTRAFAVDVALCIVLAGITAAASFERSGRIHPVAFQYAAGGLETSDIWFDADLPKLACLMTEREADQHSVTSEHPLVSLLTYIPMQAVRVITGAGNAVAIRTVVALESATWIAILFVLVRAIGCGTIAAVVFAMLGAVSAAGMFWMAVPEAFLPGAITLMVPLVVATRVRVTSELGVAVASAATLSVTVTNWIAGLALAAAEVPFRRALQISANALVIVSVLWFAQSWLFPENVYFLGSSRAVELLGNEHPNPLQAITVMLSHSMVMPAIGSITEPRWRGLTIQSAWPGSSGVVGAIAVLLWAALLCLGAVRLLSPGSPRALRVVLIVTLAGQGLHLVFGKETFLYSMHVVTLLIAVAAHGVVGRYRSLVVAMAAALVVSAGVNNWRQFESAAAFVQGIGDEAAASGATFEIPGACRS